MKEKMFVVPGSFVPFNDTVTLLTYKRLRNLDLEIDVFCFGGKIDKSLQDEISNDDHYKRFNVKRSSDYNWAISRNHPLRLPVSLILMNKYVTDSVKEYEKSDYKYLYTSIVPGISHICGKKIKEKHPEVIWYASFSDPFKGSPYKNIDLSNRSILYRIAFNVGSYCFYNDKYEEAAVLNADKLIFICEEQRDFTLSQYSNYEELKKKSIIMPLTYIPEWKMYKSIINAQKTSNKVKQAVHLGRLYGLRKIDSFLEALKELNDEIGSLENRIVFHQYSEIQPADVEKINEYGLSKLFVLHDKVSYQESIEIMKGSDILVLFDTLMPEAKIQPYLPSKIVEYLLLKKPILGVCDNNSPSYRILKEYGFNTIGSSKQQIKENVKSLIYEKNHIDYSLDNLSSNAYNMLEL